MCDRLNVEELVVRAQVGDDDAYQAIYQRFKDMALSYAYSLLGDYELAEDARQEAFLGAYVDLMTLRDPKAFPAWFKRIVHSHSLTIRRGRREIVTSFEGAPEPEAKTPDPAQAATSQQTEESVRQAIARLPDRERDITRRYYLERQSIKTIERELDVPRKTIKSRLYTARLRLRQKLMGTVKDTIHKQTLAGDKTATRAATGEAIAQFDRELRTLLRVPSAPEYERAGQLLCAKGRLQRFTGKIDEALASFEEGLSLPALKSNALHRTRFRAEIGLTHVQTSDYPRARKALMNCRATLERLGERGELEDPPPKGAPALGRWLLAAVLNGLGLCAWGEGAFAKARRFYDQTLEVSRKTRCEALEAEACNNLALLDWKAGRLEDALRNFQACLERWKKMRNRFAWSVTLMNSGVIEENLGRTAAARRHYEKALQLAENVGFLQAQAAGNANLANLALGEDKWPTALERSLRAFELARQIGDRRSQAIALENLALAQLGLGRDDEAHDALQKARRLAKAIGDRERLLSLELADLERLLRSERPRGLAGRLKAAEQTVKRKGYRSELPRLLRLRAGLELETGQRHEAKRSLTRATRECQKQKNRPEQNRILALKKRLAENE